MLAERDKKALYDEVKTRHEDIVKLESSIKELHGLFVELATLIHSQVFWLVITIIFFKNCRSLKISLLNDLNFFRVKC